jgi:hypothetical protein
VKSRRQVFDMCRLYVGRSPRAHTKRCLDQTSAHTALAGHRVGLSIPDTADGDRVRPQIDLIPEAAMHLISHKRCSAA